MWCSLFNLGVGMVTTATRHRLADWLQSNDIPVRSPLSQIATALTEANRHGLPAFGDVGRGEVAIPTGIRVEGAILFDDSSGRAGPSVIMGRETDKTRRTRKSVVGPCPRG